MRIIFQNTLSNEEGMMFHLNDRLFAVDAVLFQLVREHALDRLRENAM